jgi:hypothetical protein
MLATLSLLTSLVSLALLVIVAYKVRCLHIAMIELTDKTRAIHQESKVGYSQIQAYLDLTRLLKLEHPLPTLRNWAASPDFLLIISQHALKHKPATIVECSSGASTVVLARCAQLNGAGHVYSLEHEPQFAAITRQNLENAGLSEWATVIDAPLIQLAELPEHRWYSTEGLGGISNIDMVVVDGPPATTCKLARYPALPMLEGRLSDLSHLYMDDAARPEETEMVRRWIAERDPGTISVIQIPCEKGCAVLSVNRRP